jgi:hypothetical protein
MNPIETGLAALRETNHLLTRRIPDNVTPAEENQAILRYLEDRGPTGKPWFELTDPEKAAWF